jgi:hypothetical protein
VAPPLFQLGLFLFASFVGVVVGAFLQYFFSIRAEQLRQVQTRRTEAYVELVKAVAALAEARDDMPQHDLRQLQVQYGEARARVAIYGSARVVAAVGRVHAMPTGSKTAQALVDVIEAMRADGLGAKESPLPEGDIERLMFPASKQS